MANSAKIYDLTVRLKGDTAGYQSTIKKATTTNHQLTNSVTGVSKGLTAINGPLNGVTGRFTALSGLVSGTAGAYAVAGASVAAFSLLMVSSIKEHDQLALRNKKQEALLRSTGYAAGFAAHELDVMAKSIALSTLASVEGIKDTQNVLLTFKGVAEESFEDAIVLSQDMAAVMGTDSKSAALQLGKALESPTEGISALKKAGVSFSKAEREMIRSMEDAGNVADAQSYILETLKKQIGGAGQAEAGTLAGAVDTLSQRWQTLKVNVAEDSGAAAGMKNLATGMAAIVDRVNHLMEPDDNSRLAELWVESENLRNSLDKLYSGERDTFLSWIVGTDSDAMNVERSLKAVEAEMEEIRGRQKKRKEEEKVADDAAAENKKKKSDELVAQKLAEEQKKTDITQAKYAADLASMDMQFASEAQKIELKNQNQLARIEAWQLSEQEVATRGFESMAELQDSFRELANQKRLEDLEKIRLATQQSEIDKTKIITDAAKDRAAKEAAIQKAGIAGVQSTFGQFSDALESTGKKRTGLYKAMFAAQKAAAIPAMITDTEKASTSAMALLPGPAGVALGGVVKGLGYASIGVVAGQTIAGVAHGGMGYIPEESTYLLQRGESVLSPKQNVAVTQAAERINSGSGGGGVVFNLYEDASKGGQQEETKGPSGEDIINVWVASINQGGSAAETIEQRYGLERVGR